jgi:hypothetical protein
MQRRNSLRKSAVSLVVLIGLGTAIAGCGSSTPPTTTATSTPTTVPQAESTMYAEWCALHVGHPQATVEAAIGAPYRKGTGPTQVLKQQVPIGMSYGIWNTNDWVLVAFYTNGSIYSLVALPHTIPPPHPFPCSTKR